MAKNNGNARPRGTTQRVVSPQRIRDTITVEVVNTGTTFSISQLLPSIAGRTVVPQKFFVEVLPTFVAGNTPMLANVLWQPNGDTQRKVPSGTFKVVSSVNPTNFVLDLKYLQNFVPGILQPYPSNSLEAVLLFNKSEPVLPVTLRITSHFLLMPQENL